MGCDLLGFIFFVLPPPSLVLLNALYCVSTYRSIPFFRVDLPFPDSLYDASIKH